MTRLDDRRIRVWIQTEARNISLLCRTHASSGAYQASCTMITRNYFPNVIVVWRWPIISKVKNGAVTFHTWIFIAWCLIRKNRNKFTLQKVPRIGLLHINKWPYIYLDNISLRVVPLGIDTILSTFKKLFEAFFVAFAVTSSTLVNQCPSKTLLVTETVTMLFRKSTSWSAIVIRSPSYSCFFMFRS
jgi:hypothetical protein